MTSHSQSVLAAVMRTHLPRLAGEGLTNMEISQRLNCNPSTVNDWRKRLNLPGPPQFWTREKEGQLRYYWDVKGWSATRIGKELGCSKSAVIGKAHRLDLSERPSPVKRREKAVGTSCHPSLAGAPADDKATPESPQAAPGPFQRQERTCQWPIGDPGTPGFRFCGKKIPKLPYCDEHRAIAVVRK